VSRLPDEVAPLQGGTVLGVITEQVPDGIGNEGGHRATKRSRTSAHIADEPRR
jgi:hypothetical protein